MLLKLGDYKKKLILGIIVVIVTIASISSILYEKKETQEIFHVRLADPKMYNDGIFSDIFFAKNGTYQFRFVPSGDSPEVLTVTLRGNSFSFTEDFKLEGTLHETGISKYYTWKYRGQDKIQIPDEQDIQIVINPHGNVRGPVSVYLEK